MLKLSKKTSLTKLEYFMVFKRPLTLSFINILFDENNSLQADVIKLLAQNNTQNTAINMYFHITTK